MENSHILYIEIKEHNPEQPISQKRNQREIRKTWKKWKYDIKTIQNTGYNKTSTKEKVHGKNDFFEKA